MTLNGLASATLDIEDWERILTALEHYVITQENKLIEDNAGEREWSELGDYNILIRDIQLYCIR